MSDNLNRQYLFVLPLPMSAPGLPGSLYGLAYVVTDRYFNIIGNKELITCKGVDYRLPSPSYLFSLGLDPYQIKKGLNECEFLDKVSVLLCNPNVDIFTWSSRNLTILESMCLRNIHPNNIFKNIHCLIDINRVLKMHEIFTYGQIFKSDALLTCAKKYGLNINTNTSVSVFDRLDALVYMVKTMCQQNMQMINFMLKSQNEKLNLIENAINQGKYLVDYNVKEHCIEVLKPLRLFDDYLEALYFDGANVLKKNYLINEFHVFSPAGVLTQDRQSLTGINLNEVLMAISAREHSAFEEDKVNIPLSQSFFKNFTQTDLKTYDEYMTVQKEALGMAPLSCSLNFRNLVFMLRGSNYRNTMLDNELQLYYKKCTSAIQAQLPLYAGELKAVLGRVNENSEDELKLVEKIRTYPENI